MTMSEKATYEELKQRIQELEEAESERKRMDEALRESEERFRQVYENLGVGVARVSLEYRIEGANEAYCRMLGYREAELIGKHISDITHPEIVEKNLLELSQLAAGEIEHCRMEKRFIHKSGRVVHGILNADLICSGVDGRPSYILGSVLDITERKQAEEELRFQSEIMTNMTGAVYLVRMEDGNIVYTNSIFEKMFGYGRGEMVGKHVSIVNVPAEKNPEETTNNIMTILKEGGRWQGEVNNIRKDGSIFCCYANVSVFDHSKYGRVLISVHTDITERKKGEEELKKSEVRLRSAFEASPLGIGLISKDRKIQWHNQTTARMLGYASDELQGKNTRMLYRNDAEFDRVGDAMETLGPGKSTSDMETRWVRKDGSSFDCHIRHALLDPESKSSVILAMVEDITERKKAEEERKKLEAQLNQAQKMEAIGTLAGGVAHDFNNILTTIIGNADLALMDLGKHTSLYRSITEIQKAGHRAAALTRQLLAFSRKELIRPEVLDLNTLIMNIEKMLRRLIGEDIALGTAYTPDPWQVTADPGQMEQVVMNLVVNARDAMPKGGKLTIETANVELDEDYFRDHGVENEAGPYVMLAVADTGTGMDKETRARIFEPFFTTKGMGRGTGLGLSTVYGIVKQNRGHIWVYSEPERGTTFKVYLPRSVADDEPAKTKPSPARSYKGSETILVVEDDEMLRKMAEKMLKGYGYRVLRAGNGDEAVEIAGSHEGPIHLMVTDVVMPGMSGRDLAEQLKSKVPKIKVLYMSGYTDDAIADHGVMEKDVEFIQKPFTREDLAAKVREVLDKRMPS
jgi:two-component system cell cycle sensor histidine kinase/response regulator CckA